MRFVTRTVVCFALAAMASLAVTAVAWANTATIGSDLTSVSDANGCLGGPVLSNCTAVQMSQAGGSLPLPLTSPANGIVTEWAFRSTDEVTYEFRVLRPAGGNSYAGAGTAVGVDPGASGDDILRYATALPIQQGDAIGIGPIAGDSDAGVPEHNTPGAPSNVWATTTGPPAPAGSPPPDGSTAGFTPEGGHELLLQATVKFCSVPSLKRLKKVAAKQALAAADCGVKVKKKDTHKKKFRGKVLKQKTPAGTTAAPGTVVPIVIGRK
jgi:hypothetical protein